MSNEELQKELVSAARQELETSFIPDGETLFEEFICYGTNDGKPYVCFNFVFQFHSLNASLSSKLRDTCFAKLSNQKDVRMRTKHATTKNERFHLSIGFEWQP